MPGQPPASRPIALWRHTSPTERSIARVRFAHSRRWRSGTGRAVPTTRRISRAPQILRLKARSSRYEPRRHEEHGVTRFDLRHLRVFVVRTRDPAVSKIHFDLQLDQAGI